MKLIKAVLLHESVIKVVHASIFSSDRCYKRQFRKNELLHKSEIFTKNRNFCRKKITNMTGDFHKKKQFLK